jgi:hypothetical protein
MSSKYHRNDPSTRRGTSFNRQLIERFPVTLSAADLLASGAAAEGSPPEPISFDPVPRRRNRKGGWTEQAQRDFIACLQLSGAVAAAARAVGKSASTAYRLLEVEGADSFAIAWDKARQEGLDRLRDDSLDRALNGALVPVYRKGRLVRVEHRRNDRMAIALLGGRDTKIYDYRRGALRAHVYKMEVKAEDKRRAEETRLREEAQRAYDEELQRMLDKAASKRVPRLRSL